MGKEKWKDFLHMSSFFRSMVQVSHLQIDNGQTPEFLKPFTNMTNHLCITNSTDPNVTESNVTEPNVELISESISESISEPISEPEYIKNLIQRIEILEDKISKLNI